MNKNKIELELILTSAYNKIIMDILKTHKNLSVNKTLVFAYLIKKRRFFDFDIYNASNKNDVVLKCISQLSGLYKDYCDNIKYIISAIHLLIINNKIAFHIGELIYLETSELFQMENSFINRAISESKQYSDRQFLKEVIRNV